MMTPDLCEEEDPMH